MSDRKKIAGVDLFCGAGGLTYGLRQAGIDVRAGYDIDPEARFAYEHNNQAKFIDADIYNVAGEQIASHYGSGAFTLLAGCAPCQPFSSYTNPIKTVGSKWGLLGEFGRLVGETKPDLVTMENVPLLIERPIFKKFVQTLDENGYHVWFDVINCVDFGLPQRRRRLVLLASQLGPIQLNFPRMVAPKTVKDAISKLPHINAGQRDEKDPLHISAKLSAKNLQRIKHSSPGGTWRDWPDELIANCHKKPSGASYPSVYGRMEWDKPSPTMTTQCYGFGNGRFGHPEQDRGISLREAALLQSFPKKYQFVEPGQKPQMRKLGTLIGNAVPVKLASYIGKSLVRHVNSYL